jgi:hypothetical protein
MKAWVGAAVIVMAAAVAQAQDAKLDDAAIGAALSGQSLVYDDGSNQTFKAGGETVYDNGRLSTGRWSVRDGRYCSVWPPSDQWACYDVLQSADGQTTTFVADDGSLSVGHRPE